MVAVALLAALAVPSTPYQWRNVEIVGGGFVTGVVTHPKAKNLVYARTDIGGAYRWNQRTKRWIPLQDWLPRSEWNLYGVESLALDPNDPRRVYLAVGTYTNQWGGNGAILRSSDQGRTWSRTDLPFKNGGNEDGRGIGERLAVDPFDGRTLYFGSRHEGLWRSADRGATWNKVESFPAQSRANRIGIGWVQFDPFHRGALTIGVASKDSPLYRSEDQGSSWQPIETPRPGLMPHHSAYAADGTLYVTFGNAPGPNGVTDGGIWKLQSGRWRDIAPLKSHADDKFGYGGVSCVGDRLLVSTVDRWGKDTLFLSLDRGATWRSLAETALRDSSKAPYLNWGHPTPEFGHWIADCEIDPHNPDHAWYVTGATIWTTNDLASSPSHWQVAAEGLEETAVLDLVSAPVGAHVVSALGDIAGYAHFDLLHSPEQGISTTPQFNTVTDVDFAESMPLRLVRVGQSYQGAQHGAISDDGGRTWRPLKTDPPASRGGGSIAVSADGKTIVWAAEGAVPRATVDEGATWQPCEGAPAGGRLISDRVDPHTFYLLAPGRLFVSHDDAKRFQPAAEVTAEEIGNPLAVFGRRGHLWLATSNGLLRSTDGGETFNQIPTVQKAEQIGVGKAAPDGRYPALYLIGVVDGVAGVFRSTDEARSWTRINDAKTGFGTMQRICGDPKQFGRAYVGTNGRGVLVADPK